MPDQLPFWAQVGIGALGILALAIVFLIGAGTKRFGRLWVFGWTYDAKAKEAEEWKAMALDLLGTTKTVVEAASQNTTMSPEQAAETLRVLGIKSAEDARRVIREAGRDRHDAG